MVMKKNVVIVILSLISISSILYAFIQKGIAEKATQEALEMKVIADTQRKEAEMQRILAEQNMARAIANEKMAMEQHRLAQEFAARVKK